MFKPGSKDFPRRLDLSDGRVEMAHGAGARDMTQLIEELFLEAFDNLWLKPLDDQARLPRPNGRLVVATDTHVISPLFFPGGDIGTLAVNGTVNDLAMSGARPLYLTAAFVLEEGFPLKDLARIVASLARAATEARVPVVAGDTKVVERGKADGVYITTTGIGSVALDLNIAADRAQTGDRVLVSGPV
ncbi:MAG: AIR synthase related protein, partial [Candidatus Competibacteraceae bacterium]|nr:AIR synthase related protein [Candidatus Competibacteraceae bacterium]